MILGRYGRHKSNNQLLILWCPKDTASLKKASICLAFVELDSRLIFS